MRDYSDSEFNDLPPGYRSNVKVKHPINLAAKIVAIYHKALREIENNSMDARIATIAGNAIRKAQQISREA